MKGTLAFNALLVHEALTGVYDCALTPFTGRGCDGYYFAINQTPYSQVSVKLKGFRPSRPEMLMLQFKGQTLPECFLLDGDLRDVLRQLRLKEISLRSAQDKSAKVFLVEDDRSYRKFLKLLLEAHGCQVVLEASGYHEAIHSIQSLRSLGVNLALVDGDLGHSSSPNRDGSEVAAAIRATSLNIQIIAIPSQHGEKYGHTLPKGFENQELFDLIELLV